MWSEKLMWIAWPAFLSACGLELVVFALVDPADLTWYGRPIAWSRQGIYTAAFFTFWAASAVASTLTSVLKGSAIGSPQPGAEGTIVS